MLGTFCLSLGRLPPVLPLLFAALLPLSCRQRPAAGWPLVGVSLLTKTHPFYGALEQGMREAAAREKLELKIQSAEFDTATQTAQIENFITQRVRAIVVCPVDSQAVGGALRRASWARVPVFTADIRALQGQVVSHIASNNLQGGRLVGELLARALGGKGKVAVIDHPEVTSAQERVRGFKEAMAAKPGIRIVAILSGAGVRDRAATVMENLLQAHADLDGVFGINDNTALGAISVLEARGNKRVKVVGFDADPEGRDAIRRGVLLGDAAQDPQQIGARSIETVARHLRGERVPAEVAIETRIVDASTLRLESR